eukprot:7377374-Prymnesium_polylepis.1
MLITPAAATSGSSLKGVSWLTCETESVDSTADVKGCCTATVASTGSAARATEPRRSGERSAARPNSESIRMDVANAERHDQDSQRTHG